MTERDYGPVVRTVEAWRNGAWVFVSLDGEVVYKRHTRDPVFTTALVCFWDNQSPSHPKTRATFKGVELRGPWPLRRRGPASGFGNAIEVPINTEGRGHP